MGELFNAKRRYLLAPGAPWLAVTTPINCNFIGIRNAGNVKVEQSTDPNNPDAWDDLPPGWGDPIAAGSPGAPRFPVGTTVMFLRVVGGAEQGDVRFHFVF